MPPGVIVFLNVFVESKELERVTEALAKLPEIVDVYEVTGEYDLIAIIKTDTIAHFRQILKDKILKIRGIRSTVSAVVLHMHKKDGKHVSE